MESIQYWASVTVVFGFLGSIFSYFILTPLNTAIKELRVTIGELRKEIKNNEERRHALEIKVAEIDQSTRSAHHRIDTLEKGIKE